MPLERLLLAPRTDQEAVILVGEEELYWGDFPLKVSDAPETPKHKHHLGPRDGRVLDSYLPGKWLTQVLSPTQ